MFDPMRMIESLPRRQRDIAWVTLGLMTLALWIAVIIGSVSLI